MSPLLRPPLRIRTRQDACRLFAGLDRTGGEALGIAFLGSERTLLGLRHVAGHADSVGVPLARVARDAILLAAKTVVMAHNHPDGDPRPSAADLTLTRRLAQGLAALDVKLLDHLILSRGAVVSLRDQGIL